MTKKRILVWETLSTIGGGQQMTLTVMDMLRDRFDFLCLIPGEGMLAEELKKREIPYKIMGDQTLPAGVKGKSVIFRYGWMSVKSICKSLIQIVRFRPDVLYAPGPAALPWSAVCGALTGKPAVWHLHHIFQDGPTKKLLNLCAKWKTVRRIISISRCVGDQITDAGTREKLEVLYNPVDYERFAAGNGAAVRKEMEARLGRSLENAVIIGHVGLIQRMKRQDFVVSLLSRLRRSGQDVIGLFAGECREPDYQAELEKQAEDCHVGDRVVFLGRRNDVPDILCAMDVLVIPSVEGFSLAGEEAAAAGVPIAACGVAGTAELIAASGNGLTFRENDPDSAVEAVERILKEKEEMTRNGRVFAEQMSAGAYAKRVNRVFEASCNG